MAEHIATERPSLYEVQHIPPAYPARMFPGRCRHEPQFKLAARCESVRFRSRTKIEISHHMCLACGRSLPATYGGNVLVDVEMLLAEFGWHRQLAARLHAIRAKWARIATYLFSERGWTGRHEAVARLIDPNLTMRLAFETGPDARGVRLGRISFDRSYMREAAHG